jgi:hypothetical protein
MSKITLAANTSGVGTVTVTVPNTNTNRTITLPDETTTLIGAELAVALAIALG